MRHSYSSFLHRTIFAAALFLLALWVLTHQSTDASEKKKSVPRGEIAITFDELPISDPFGKADRSAVTYLLLEALSKHQVKATGFVVGQQIDSDYDLLGEWLNSGHTLGSMTHSNQDYNDIEIGRFITEIRMGHDALEEMLSGFGQKKRYFRYPFLNYGPDQKSRREAEAFLKSHQISIAHATIAPDDYVYDMSLSKFGRVPDSAERDVMMNEYLNYVFDELERVEALSLELVQRPVKQILRLRANRLNGLYLDDLLTALQEEGYRFIPLDQALTDPIYKKAEAYFDPKGVGFLDRLAASDPDLIPAK